MLNPVWLQYASHKIGRLLVPWALLVAFVSSAALALDSWFYAVPFGVQAAFYSMAAYGGWSEHRARRSEAFAQRLGEVVR